MNQTPRKLTTLCFLLKEDKILLAMKKRGFGKDKWNGVGGKCLPDESLESAAIREAQEEIGITPQLEKVGIITFTFPESKKDWNEECHIFLAQEWLGEPEETEEMAPAWFKSDELPFENMWPDDFLWLPQVITGTKIRADFFFNEEQQLQPNYTVHELPKDYRFKSHLDLDFQ